MGTPGEASGQQGRAKVDPWALTKEDTMWLELEKLSLGGPGMASRADERKFNLVSYVNGEEPEREEDRVFSTDIEPDDTKIALVAGTLDIECLMEKDVLDQSFKEFETYVETLKIAEIIRKADIANPDREALTDINGRPKRAKKTDSPGTRKVAATISKPEKVKKGVKRKGRAAGAYDLSHLTDVGYCRICGKRLSSNELLVAHLLDVHKVKMKPQKKRENRKPKKAKFG